MASMQLHGGPNQGPYMVQNKILVHYFQILLLTQGRCEHSDGPKAVSTTSTKFGMGLNLAIL